MCTLNFKIRFIDTNEVLIDFACKYQSNVQLCLRNLISFCTNSIINMKANSTSAYVVVDRTAANKHNQMRVNECAFCSWQTDFNI